MCQLHETKLPEELGVVKTTAAQTKPPKEGLSFGWTEFKMHYHCCEFKMAVFLHISTELKWLQIQKIIFVLYIYVSVILTKTNSGQYGHILRFL